MKMRIMHFHGSHFYYLLYFYSLLIFQLLFFYINDYIFGLGTGFELNGPVGNAGGYDKVRIVTFFNTIKTLILPNAKPLNDLHEWNHLTAMGMAG